MKLASVNTGRRKLFKRAGQVGLGATAVVFKGGQAAKAETLAPYCCGLVYSHVSWNFFQTRCGCSGSGYYVWTCCHGGYKYYCGECHCQKWSSYKRGARC